MRPRIGLSSLAFAVGIVRAVVQQQALFSPQALENLEAPTTRRPWNERPGEDATGHLIFQSAASLLQMAPNSRRPNGHSIVRASIPAGTLLYHGSPTREYPPRDWLAFDPEHAFIFARGSNGTLFTFVTTRELNFVYFDGCSANKLGPVVDTQDIFYFGEIGHSRGDWKVDDLARFNAGCEWGKPYGVDGFVRMEWEFEIMYCDFSQGIELVSVVPTVNGLSDVASPPEDFSGSLLNATHPPIYPPKGWKGTLPFTYLETRHAGTWNNDFPGEVRVHVYPSTLVSFFDPALTSLVAARRSQTREQYRAGNISMDDIARVRADVTEMMSRDWSVDARGSIDWVGLLHVIQDRFADRLPYMQYLLHNPAANVSERMVTIRKQLVVSLIPYIPLREDIGSSDWFADTAYGCAESFTRRLPVDRLTKQERVLQNAVEDVLHEICRVYTEAWVEAFDVEDKSEKTKKELMFKWKGEFAKLIEWLDWPSWVKCEPTCGPDEYCLVPQARFWWYLGTEPICISMEDETLRV